MRAADRCKEHHSGDKCRLDLGHSGNHVGQFAEWNKQTVVRSTKMLGKRSRKANQVIRSSSNMPIKSMDSKERKFAIEMLGKAITWLRG